MDLTVKEKRIFMQVIIGCLVASTVCVLMVAFITCFYFGEHIGRTSLPVKVEIVNNK